LSRGHRGPARKSGRRPPAERSWAAAGAEGGRSWTPSLLGTVLVLTLLEGTYLWFITHGTFRLIAPEDWVTLSTAFDSLGEHLLRGSSAVDPNAIGWEAFPGDGRTVTYFGPFPALVRIAFTAMVPAWSGKLARLSCFLAASLSLLAVAAIAREALAQNKACPARLVPVLFYGTLVGFGLATPLLLLASMAAVYHEAIWWGLCWNWYGMVLLVRYPASGVRTRHVGLLGLMAGLAMLSRITFAIPLLLGLAFWTVSLVRERPRVWPQLALGLVPLALLAGFQLWYNHDRFGNPLRFVRWDGYAANTPERQRHGTFDLARVPQEFRDYVLPLGDNVGPRYPWVKPRSLVYPPGGLLSTNEGEVVTALLLTSPWLLLTASIGAAFAALRRDARSLLLVGLFVPETVLLLSYYFVTQRYATELLPLLLAGHVAFLRGVGGSSREAWPAALAMAVLLPLSMFGTAVTTAAWTLGQNGVPQEFRDRLARTFLPPALPAP
jgi:hypothetical protein